MKVEVKPMRKTTNNRPRVALATQATLFSPDSSARDCPFASLIACYKNYTSSAMFDHRGITPLPSPYCIRRCSSSVLL